jgi:hypothetical protein
MNEKYAIVKIKDENGNNAYQFHETGFSTKDEANDVRKQKYNEDDYIVVLYWC